MMSAGIPWQLSVLVRCVESVATFFSSVVSRMGKPLEVSQPSCFYWTETDLLPVCLLVGWATVWRAEQETQYFSTGTAFPHIFCLLFYSFQSYGCLEVSCHSSNWEELGRSEELLSFFISSTSTCMGSRESWERTCSGIRSGRHTGSIVCYKLALCC